MEEENGLLPLFEKTESFPRSRENYGHVRGFGKCDSITNLEEADLSETLRKYS
jgi:hypothetical protein